MASSSSIVSKGFVSLIIILILTRRWRSWGHDHECRYTMVQTRGGGDGVLFKNTTYFQWCLALNVVITTRIHEWFKTLLVYSQAVQYAFKMKCVHFFPNCHRNGRDFVISVTKLLLFCALICSFEEKVKVTKPSLKWTWPENYNLMNLVTFIHVFRGKAFLWHM